MSGASAKDLSEALAPISRELDEAVQTIETALAQLGAQPDLKLEEEDLLKEDAVQLARVAYVTSLLRLASAIRAQPRSLDQELRQGTLALGYIKHVEGANVKVMQLGRHNKDKELAHEVAAMRKKIADLAQYRKKNAEPPNEIVDVTPREETK